MVTGGGQPGPFGINTAISRLQRTPRELIMKIGLLPDPCRTHWIRAFHGARTHWIRGFMAFQLARRTRTVVRMVPR